MSSSGAGPIDGQVHVSLAHEGEKPPWRQVYHVLSEAQGAEKYLIWPLQAHVHFPAAVDQPEARRGKDADAQPCEASSVAWHVMYDACLLQPDAMVSPDEAVWKISLLRWKRPLHAFRLRREMKRASDAVPGPAEGIVHQGQWRRLENLRLQESQSRPVLRS